jgi:hypothetical protein
MAVSVTGSILVYLVFESGAATPWSDVDSCGGGKYVSGMYGIAFDFVTCMESI